MYYYVGIYVLCVANITSQYYVFVLVELVCIQVQTQ